MALKGERIDKPSYAILRSIQGGGAGEVYEAKHLVFGKKCVQKTYSTVGLEDAAAHDEPRLLYEIKHPRVAEVLEAQYDPDIQDAITFVTVYYEGRCTATAFDEDYRFSIHQAIGIVVDVLDALAYVHNDRDLRVIHRDVKPGNVFLEAGRRNARLGDWGSAARIDGNGTVAGIEGSPLYTPPEAGPSDGSMDITGDVYGAAITLFEMLNGPFPYAEIDPQVVDRRLTRGWKALPETAFQFAPHIPGPLRSVLAKGMRANPRSRWQSASAFITALQRVECIDWIHVDGDALDGRWFGSWPPSKPQHRRRHYEVTSTILTGGAQRGQRRLKACQALPGSDNLARFGVEDETAAPDDRQAIERFFSAVEAKAAQRSPAR